MNLKEAAHRLGVHYQTAYRWVRSGELVAVRVGSRYEISDAAIERFHATRSALSSFRLDDPLPAADITFELTSMVELPVVDLDQAVAHVARRIAETTGDLALVGVFDTTHTLVEAAAVFDPEPARPPMLAGAIAATMRQRKLGEGPLMRTARERQLLFIPHVPQGLLRSWIPAEYHQIFDDVSIFGLIVAPMLWHSAPIGLVTAVRRAGDRPMTEADAEHLGELADLAGPVMRAARADRHARDTLHAIVDEARLVDAELDPTRAQALAELRSGAIALRDGHGEPLAATAPYVEAVGPTTPPTLPRLISGELDVGFDLVHGAETSLVHHGVVRAVDATLRGIVSVARPVEPPETSHPPLVNATA